MNKILYLFLLLLPTISFSQEVFYESENWRVNKIPNITSCFYISTGSDFVINIEETTNDIFNVMVRHKALTSLPIPDGATIQIKVDFNTAALKIELPIFATYVTSEFLLIELPNNEEMRKNLHSSSSITIHLTPVYSFDVPIESGIDEANAKAKDCVKFGDVPTEEAYKSDGPVEKLYESKKLSDPSLGTILRQVNSTDMAMYKWIMNLSDTHQDGEIQQFGIKTIIDNMYVSMVSMNIPVLPNPEELVETYRNLVNADTNCELQILDVIANTSTSYVIHFGSLCNENDRQYYSLGYIIFLGDKKIAYEISITGYSEYFNETKDKILEIEDRIKTFI
jgi:hypothetical protein